MKKNVLALLIASSISLYGCGDESELTGNPTIDPGIEKSLQAKTKIEFDLEKQIIVSPSFLAMDSDGTVASELKVKMEGGDPTDLTNPAVAIGKVDGWGTTMPFNIKFSGKLDPSTAQESFHLIKSSDPTKKAPIQRLERLSAKNGDFLVMVSEKTPDTLTVVLLKPLDPASNYMFAITDKLKDDEGQEVGITRSYNGLKMKAKPPIDTLIPLQNIVHKTEDAFKIDGVDPKKITFSSWFTTASAGSALKAARAATALSFTAIKAKNEKGEGNGAAEIWGKAKSNSVSNADLDKLYTMTAPTTPSGFTPGDNLIYKGFVYLPYFLEASTDQNKVSEKTVLGTPWQSAMPSLAKIINVKNRGSSLDKAALEQILNKLNISDQDLDNIKKDPLVKARVLKSLIGEKIILPSGQLDKDRLITQYSPIPQLKSVQKVEYSMVVPKNCTNPGTNNIAIYQHGITSSKSVLVEKLNSDEYDDDKLKKSSIADILINGDPSDTKNNDSCQIIFAIDHPLHNTRKVETLEGTLNASEKSGLTTYMNLVNLTVGRDNLRQSAIDIVNFRAALGFKLSDVGTKLAALKNDQSSIEAKENVAKLGVFALLNPKPDSNGLPEVSLVGHSLGAISGITAAQISNDNIYPASEPEKLNNEKYLFNFKSVALASPGAGIPHLLLRSVEYGNLVKGSILAKDPSDSGNEFRNFCKKLSIDGKLCPGAFPNYQDKLIKDNNINELKAIYAQINKFAYAAQTVLDTSDPFHYASSINPDTAIYLNVVKNDGTIPNKLNLGTPIKAGVPVLEPYSSFAGTLPLIKAIGITPTVTDVKQETVKHAVLFTKGHHSSINTAKNDSEKAVTIEINKEIKSLLDGKGQSLEIDEKVDFLTDKPEVLLQ